METIDARSPRRVQFLDALERAAARYLQVERSNATAASMYERVGFGEASRYCHRTEAV